MRTRISNPDVVVVGGGPCGLFAALLLARRGVRCAVLEKNSGTATHPKAMGLSRRTCEIFRQAGVLDAIDRGGLSLDGRSLGIWSKSLVGEELGRIPLPSTDPLLTPCRSRHCPQTWTERVLADALEAEPLASLEFGIEVCSVALDDGAARVSLSGGDVLETGWVLAADGAGSRIRKEIGIGTDGPGDLGHFVNTLFRADFGRHLQDRKAILYQALGTNFFEFFVAVNGSDLWLMHHFLEPGESASDFTPERMESLIRTASGLADEPIEVLGMSPWVMSPKVARSWRQGRLLLVGDSAARLSPAGGLGLNNGLQSVHNLAWKLAAVIRGQASDALLDTYESERRPCALQLMQNTNRNADEVFAIVAAAMRGDWDAARDMIAHSRRAGSGLGQDLGLAYAAGAFVPDGSDLVSVEDPANDYVPSGRPGGRAPHLSIQDADGRTSLLDLFGAGFVVLAGRSGGGWKAASAGASFFQNGEDFDAPDFEGVYGIAPAGAVLVRPDGYVAARYADGSAPGAPASAIIRLIGSGAA